MTKKTLLLNATHEVLSFINEKKALKLFVKGKVDILSVWADEQFILNNGLMHFPSILRLKYFIKKKYTQLAFSRKAVFKRDRFTCQFCGKPLKSGQATVDHLIPKSIGGISSFNNCVTSCYICNNKKGNRTPEQANMVLLSKPITPAGYLYQISDNDRWHPEWNEFFDVGRKF